MVPAIEQLRNEGLLPRRKTRKDKGHPQWTERDEYLWEYIGFMQAVRFDQIQCLAARESPCEIDGDSLSISRTSEMVSH